MTFDPPAIPARIETGTALAIALNRAERAEAAVGATLDYIDADRVRDVNQDDVQARCAEWARGVAEDGR